jgi:hypothetical protein
MQSQRRRPAVLLAPSPDRGLQTEAGTGALARRARALRHRKGTLCAAAESHAHARGCKGENDVLPSRARTNRYRCAQQPRRARSRQARQTR